jgi:hypothetical protein
MQPGSVRLVSVLSRPLDFGFGLGLVLFVSFRLVLFARGCFFAMN